MSHLNTGIAGIDIGKNSFHLVGQDNRGAIVLRQKWSRKRNPPSRWYHDGAGTLLFLSSARSFMFSSRSSAGGVMAAASC